MGNGLRHPSFEDDYNDIPATPELASSGSLYSQIGNYGLDDDKYDKEGTLLAVVPNPKLGVLTGAAQLNNGITAYAKSHQAQADEYVKDLRSNTNKKGGANPDLFLDMQVTTTDPQFFRKQFIHFIQNNEFKPCAIPADQIASNPTDAEKAALNMKDLLGSEGTKLYKLALEEERYSKEYMTAVFRKSCTEHKDAPPWDKRPVIIIASPSGCGKSHAANAVVQETLSLLDQGRDQHSNVVVSVDGGVARETSQIRKLAIQVANNHGYSGIRDLHEQSKVLSNVKDHVLAAAKEEYLLGIVIPETFVSSMLSLTTSVETEVRELSYIDYSETVFCTIANPEDSDAFKTMVAKQGMDRAWKREGLGQVKPYDLNMTGLAESKAYSSSGFYPGLRATQLAEKAFTKLKGKSINFEVTNDRMVMKENPKVPGTWVRASENDKDTIFVSQRTFDAWQKDSASGKTSASLPTYARQNPPETLIQRKSKEPSSKLQKLAGADRERSQSLSEQRTAAKTTDFKRSMRSLTAESEPNKGKFQELDEHQTPRL